MRRQGCSHTADRGRGGRQRPRSRNGPCVQLNGDGTLTVVRQDSPDKYTVVDNLQTQRGARTMALDLKTHDVYLVTAEFGPPPAPTADQPRPRPSIVPGSFTVLVVGR